MRKDLRPAIYVTGDVAGAIESPVYAILAMNRKLDAIRVNGAPIARYNAVQPDRLGQTAIKWDGEWLRVRYRVVLRLLPRHFFVYIFINGFFRDLALTVFGVGLAATLILVIAGAYEWDYLATEYLPYFLLLGFSEAWLSGMLITLFVIYRPNWVATFDDSSYLANK